MAKSKNAVLMHFESKDDIVLGTGQWLAPEIKTHMDAPVWTSKCDIFSLGMLVTCGGIIGLN